MNGEPEKNLPDQESQAELRILNGVEAGRTHCGCDFCNHVAPARVIHGVDRNEDGSNRQQHVLDEVGDDHRHHSADYRIKKFQEQNRRHHGNQIPAVNAADDRQEFTLDLQEYSHVEDAADCNENSGEKPEPTAVLVLEVLGNCHQSEGTKARNDKAGTTHHDHHQSGDQRGGKRGETVLVAEFAVVHERDGADFGSRERGDACIHTQFSSSNQVMRHVANVLLADQSYGDAQNQVADDNRPINNGKMHSCSCRARFHRMAEVARALPCRRFRRNLVNSARLGCPAVPPT